MIAESYYRLRLVDMDSSVSRNSKEKLFTLPEEPWEGDWKDVTKCFKETVSGLCLGELFHDPNFSLFEAMSAIELMDPKMDAGMTRVQRCLGFGGSVEANKLKLKDLTSEEMIVTVDATWACIVTWIEGHSLVQTVFTNLYLHKPDLIEDPVMKAFCLGIMKFVSVCKDTVTRSGVFEEEDFQPTLYDFDLASQHDLSKVWSAIKESEEAQQKKLRLAKNCASSSEVSLLEGVVNRLRFVRLFSMALLAMTAKDGQVPNQFFKSQNLSEAEKLLKGCEQSLDKIAQFDYGSLKIAEDFINVMGFEPGINQRLLPPTFPRRTRMYSIPETIAYLQALVQRLLLICFMLPQRINCFSTTLEFFRYFSKGRNCLLSRSVSQLSYMPNPDKLLNQIHFLDTLKESMRTFIMPPILQQKCILLENEQCVQLWVEVLEDFGKVFPNLIHIAGHNRARQREKLASVIEDLASLQDEADKIDGYLHSVINRIDSKRHHAGVIGSFVLYHTLKVMLEYILLGFELQLYSVFEYPYIYWYLGELVYKWLANVVNKAGNFVFEQEQYLGLVPCPDFANKPEDDCLRYEHRMVPFSCLATPTYISYRQFLDMSGYREIIKHFPAERVLNDAARSFDEARSTIESVPLDDAQEVKALLRVCKNNAVVLRLVASGKISDSGNIKPPEYDFSVHKHYPLLKMVIK